MVHSSQQRVKISFSSPGAQPPIFVSGSFSNPPWNLHEMDYGPTEYGDASLGGAAEYTFVKEFEVTEGLWQYKFRLGLGDWWVCDENAEIVTDEAGNRNNLLTVSQNYTYHACINKQVHSKPLLQHEQSKDGAAWEVSELKSTTESVPSSDIPDGRREKNCHISEHFNSSCSNERDSLGSQDSARTTRPSLAYSKAASEHYTAPTRLNQRPKAEEAVADDGHYGTRKMSNLDIERVKYLMSMPNTPVLSNTICRGDFLNFDKDFDENSIQEINIHSHAPLLPHECLTCDDQPDQQDKEEFDQSSPTTQHTYEDLRDNFSDSVTPTEFDDPNLELFPSGATNILQRIATLAKEIPPDEPSELEPVSPIMSFARETPVFSHELPPLGSPAARRRIQMSLESPDVSMQSDGSSDRRPPYQAHELIDHFKLPPPHENDEEGIEDMERRASLRRNSTEVKIRHDEDETAPLLSSGSLAKSKTVDVQVQSSNLAGESEGPRHKNKTTFVTNVPSGDCSSVSDDKKPHTEPQKTIYQRVLEWLYTFWASIFGAS